LDVVSASGSLLLSFCVGHARIVAISVKARTFLVTGASKGIGRAVVDTLLAAGHQVVGISRNPDPSFPGMLVTMDLSDRRTAAASISDLVAKAHFDGVVNNVGRGALHRLGEIDLDDVDEIFRDNLDSSILMAQALLPSLKEQGWGRIVNVGSLVVLGMENRTAYAAAKAALTSFTRTWALELAQTGITVNMVAPGPTETELFRRATPAGSEAERVFLAHIPMKRLGSPNEIASAIAFFLSEDASYITGQTLFVDGGGSVGKAAL
jgi:3-oxoacyl-[acyl-carrier protein] reductase